MTLTIGFWRDYKMLNTRLRNDRPSKSEQAAQQHNEEILQAETSKPVKRMTKKQRVQEKLKSAQKSPTQPDEPITRSNKRITYYINNLDVDDRKRDDVGAAINFPFFVEEFRAIQEAYNKVKNEVEAKSFSDYLRQVLKDHAKKTLGADEYKKIIDERLNQRVESLPPVGDEPDDTNQRTYG